MEGVLQRQPLEEEEELLQPKGQDLQSAPRLQRQAESEEEEELLQTKPAGGRVAGVAADLEAGIQAQRSGGEPLSEASRSFFEPRLGVDLSAVRVHADAHADEAAGAVNARAFTVGRDVFFAAGQYTPETQAGQKLMAHELAHVVQQRQARQPPALKDEVLKTGPAAGPPNAHRTTIGDRLQRKGGSSQSEAPLSRRGEIRLSRRSPGGVSGSARPLRIEVYNFAIDRATLKPEHRAVLREIVSMVRRAGARNLKLVLLGHTDDTGDFDPNDRLSRRRARAVARVLRRSGAEVETAGLGEDVPTTGNDTVAGRSRNRRVEIYFMPRRTTKVTPEMPEEKPPPGKDDPPPGKKEPPKETEPPPGKPPPPGDDDGDWFCAEYPKVCAAIGIGIGVGIGIWFCLRNPFACLPGIPWPCLSNPLECLPDWPDGDDDDDDDDDPKEREPSPRPCPVKVRLGKDKHLTQKDLKGSDHGPYGLTHDFDMRLIFKQDETGCDCSRGEYKQVLKGFFEYVWPGGRVERLAHRLLGGSLEEDNEREDARDPQFGTDPYGHRIYSQSDEDKFLPDRTTGCAYVGEDAPGMIRLNGTPGLRMRFKLEFRGGPVDQLDRGTELPGFWRKWTISGNAVIPRPKPPETPTKPGSAGPKGGGAEKVDLTPHRPASKKPRSGRPHSVVGGTLPANPDPADHTTPYAIIVAFRTDTGDTAFTRVEVRVLDVTATHVIVETTNSVAINVAPVTDPPHQEIIIEAHHKAAILMSDLKAR